MLLECSSLLAQQPSSGESRPTVRKHRVLEETQSVSPAVTQAESALEKQDLATAEKLLTDAVAKDAADFRAWFDLGFVYRASKRDEQAVEAYRKAVALKPTLFEANLRLGQLLSSEGKTAEAIPYLRAATEQKPDSDPEKRLAEAWFALGTAQEGSDPQQAVAAYRKSAELVPSAETHAAAGAVLEKQKDYSAAEAEFRAALQMQPQSSAALAGLVNVYTAQKRLPEAEAMLRELIKREPSNASAQLQLGRVFAAENKPQEAISLLEAAQKDAPADRDLTLELARAYAGTQNYAMAAQMYQAALQAGANSAQVSYEYGVVLNKQRRSTDAQQQLIHALELDPKFTNAYSELAVAASEAKNYPLVVKVLDARGRLTPDTAGTYFLRATAYDNMKAFKEAAESYHRFLELAQGKFPDQEWQARHRLIAIEPKKK